MRLTLCCLNSNLLQEHLLQKRMIPTVVIEESALTDVSDEISSDDVSYSCISHSLPSLVISSILRSLQDGVNGRGNGNSDHDALSDGYLPFLEEEFTPGVSHK